VKEDNIGVWQKKGNAAGEKKKESQKINSFGMKKLEIEAA